MEEPEIPFSIPPPLCCALIGFSSCLPLSSLPCFCTVPSCISISERGEEKIGIPPGKKEHYLACFLRHQQVAERAQVSTHPMWAYEPTVWDTLL